MKSGGSSALNIAASEGQTAALQLLLAYRADVELKDHDGEEL